MSKLGWQLAAGSWLAGPSAKSTFKPKTFKRKQSCVLQRYHNENEVMEGNRSRSNRSPMVVDDVPVVFGGPVEGYYVGPNGHLFFLSLKDKGRCAYKDIIQWVRRDLFDHLPEAQALRHAEPAPAPLLNDQGTHDGFNSFSNGSDNSGDDDYDHWSDDAGFPDPNERCPTA